MRHYVYKITNTANGKYYYGIHSCNKDFFDDNYYGTGKLVKAAVQKYGKEHFKREVLQEFSTRQKASDFERFIVGPYFINREDNYNLCVGGDDAGILGFKHSEEAKAKISARSKNQNWSTERREKVRKALTGRKHTKESRQKMSDKLSGENSPKWGVPLSSETKAKLSKAHTGRVVSDEAKAKMSAAQKGNTNGSGNKGKKHSKKRIGAVRTCPYCEKTGVGSNMSRYHFDNCKFKEA